MTIYLGHELKERLIQLAGERNISVSRFVRETVTKRLRVADRVVPETMTGERSKEATERKRIERILRRLDR